ncbi:MAG: PilZ domain-containing protein [Hyphococcus sp.]
MADGKERRQFDRTELDLTVRFITREDLETTGQLLDISEGGLAMLTDTAAEVGDPVIAYPDRLGRLTGKVVRKFDGGVAIEFEMSEAQREHLRKRIESAMTGVPYMRLLENRKHKRVELNLDSVAHMEDGGEFFKCQIIDLSESGSLIRANKKPALGAMVRIGSLRGAVRRHTEEGFAIEFAKDAASKQKTTSGKVGACA